jgi:hypothetical protein
VQPSKQEHKMPVIKNMAPEVAHDLAEAQRTLIRGWELQRRGRAAPHAVEVTDEQVHRSVALLEELAEQLPSVEREDTARFVRMVRQRLKLKLGCD